MQRNVLYNSILGNVQKRQILRGKNAHRGYRLYMDTKAFLGDGNVLKLDGGDRYAAPEVWIV